MHISTICICGAGTMGTGIAQVAASAGFKTVLYEVNEKALVNTENKLKKDLSTLVEKEKISTKTKEDILNNLAFTSDISFCVADVVIEAIIEQMEAKVVLLKQLTRINTESTILASNTSSLSINKLASLLDNPQRVAGLHFF